VLFDFNVVGEMATSSMETIQGVIEEYFGCDSDNIENICLLKKGMTNHNYSFEISGDRAGKYLLRVPGEGTERLIDRRHEADAYKAIEGKGICDAPLMIDPDTGYKISGYIGNGRCCDPAKEDDVRRCIGFLKGFHALDLSVDHEFDLYGQLEYYELLECVTQLWTMAADRNMKFEKRWYDDAVYAPFEQIQVPVPTGYHEILTKWYGDYMKAVKFEAGHDYPFYKKYEPELERLFAQRNQMIPECFRK